MSKIFNELDKMKDVYYDDDIEIDNDTLKLEFMELQKEIDTTLKLDENPEDVKLFVCPDIEGEFPVVYEYSEKYEADIVGSIFNGELEYNTYSDFYDEITGLTGKDLSAIILNELEISIVKFWKSKYVESLNIKKMNSMI